MIELETASVLVILYCVLKVPLFIPVSCIFGSISHYKMEIRYAKFRYILVGHCPFKDQLFILFANNILTFSQ